MAIIIRGNASAWIFTAAATSLTPTLPTHQAGDMLIVRAVCKAASGQAPSSAAITCSTSGWNPVAAQFNNGTDVNANGAGSVAHRAFYKIATSSAETNPQVNFGLTPSPAQVCSVVYQKGAAETWVTPTGAGGGDNTPRTSQTCTIASHIATASGDMVDFFLGCTDNVAITVPTFTQAGLTLGTVAEQPATAGITADGFDGATDGGYRLVTAGTSSAAAVVTATFGASEQGGAWTTRLRVTDNRDASVVATGGGILTSVRVKGGQSAAVATGGGIYTHSFVRSAKHVDASVVATGGGVVAVGRVKGGQTAAVATGGGVAVVAGRKTLAVSITATGAGVVVVTSHKGINLSLTATGGGVSAVTSRKGGSVAAVATGGGIAAIAWLKGATVATAPTGGGVAIIDGRKGWAYSVTATGGGVAVISTARVSSGSIVATGGGVAVTSALKGGQSAAIATGGGIYVHSYIRSGGGNDKVYSVVATGGGVAVIDQKHAGTLNATATGAGSAIVSHAKSSAVAVAATGGGAASLSVLAARAFAAAMTGGGVVVIDATKAVEQSITATGGGIVVVTYTRSGNHKSVSVDATGGGVVGLDVLSGRFVALTMTGGGVVVIDAPYIPAFSVKATGGGVFTKGPTPLQEIESVIGMSIDSGLVGAVISSDVVAIVSITTASPILIVNE